MIKGKLIEARAEAEKATEQILRVFRHTLIEVYMEGFMKGVESREESEESLERMLADEGKAFNSGEQPVAEEPLVRLKPGAILKRRLKQDEFSARV